jgi:putative transposase
VPVPFGELAWDHARRGLGQGAGEEEIADAVAALLRRAGKGPEEDGKPALSKRDRRVAARTRAAAPKEPQPAPPEPGSPSAAEQAEAGEPLAKVIPMPIFDPFAEADKPW